MICISAGWQCKRGFRTIAQYLYLFFKEKGMEVKPFYHWSNNRLEGSKDDILIMLAHWYFPRLLLKRVKVDSFNKSILYTCTEGKITESPSYFNKFDKVFSSSKWVQGMLKEQDIESEVAFFPVDTQLFKPISVKKELDVLSIGVIESPNDNRKFMDKVPEVCGGLRFYNKTTSDHVFTDIPELYNKARVYLSLSGAEGANIPVLEAMACGLPVVYNDCSSTSEIANGIGVPPLEYKEDKQGFLSYLVGVPDIKTIREELLKLLQDEVLIQEISKVGLELVKEYDYRVQYQKIWDYIC